jgi:hypothetical protein
MASDYLTLGTIESTGLPELSEGHLTLRAKTGAPGGADNADVVLDFAMDDVFTKTLADYTGELRTRVRLQITDKDLADGPGAGTTIPIPLELNASCTAVPDPQEGSTCSEITTADALAPGAVKEGDRAVWQLGSVEVYDGGADGDVHTPAGDTLFATQGIFVP